MQIDQHQSGGLGVKFQHGFHLVAKWIKTIGAPGELRSAQNRGESGYVKKLSQVNGKFVNRCVDSSKNAPFSAVTMLCSHLSGG
ncbi:hypothetical protein M5585_14340 [Serratia ureilytica]